MWGVPLEGGSGRTSNDETLASRGPLTLLIEVGEAPDPLLPAAVLSRQPYLLRARVIDDA
jgi:hypothetical protein